MSDDLREAARRRGSIVQTARAVGWSFLGIRRSDGHEHDVGKLNPVHVVVVGIAAAVVFVVALVVAVNWIVSSGVMK